LSTRLLVTKESHQRSVTVRAVGEVDVSTVLDLAVDVEHACARAEAALVVVDLRYVTFLGASGIALLDSAARRCSQHGTTLRVLAHDRVVLRPLRMMGVDQKLTLVVTDGEAIGTG